MARRSWLQLVLQRILAIRRGRVRAMEEAQHLERVLRFILVVAITIVTPALLLATFGLESIRTEELAVAAEVEREAEGTANAFWSQTDRAFSAFEQRVRDRLEAGRSPVEGSGELHAQLLVSLRFSEDGRLLAPFRREPTTRVDPAGFFTPEWIAARAALNAGASPGEIAELFRTAAASARSRAFEGRARFELARALGEAGDTRAAVDALEEIVERYPDLRDPWGMRLGDLARLERAELLMRTASEPAPEQGTTALRELVESLLTSRWIVGQGAEAAVARRALSLLEPYGEREWAASTRGRVAERSTMLYWAGELLPELEHRIATTTGLRVSPGDLHWRIGEQALWATTWWDGDFYAFGLDLEAITSALKADAHGGVHPDSPVAAYLLSPPEPVPDDPLVQKSLAPWLTGWSLVVTVRDPAALEATQRRKRNQRIGVIVLAVLVIGLGAFMSAGLIQRDLHAARVKTDFAASVSHELRSPITQIRLKGEALLLGLAETPEELEQAYRAIVRESERLSRLVDNVLDFSAIERGAKTYSLRAGDIEDTVLRAIGSVSESQELADRELDVELPPDLPEVHHDPDAVAQCVINLVSNAAKYSSSGGWIGVRGRVASDGVEIVISDRGIGIAPAELRHVFEPFFRSPNPRARRRKGTGIGLTITRYIMRAHGGSVSVQSRFGEGSTFTLRFPFRDKGPIGGRGGGLGRDNSRSA